MKLGKNIEISDELVFMALWLVFMIAVMVFAK